MDVVMYIFTAILCYFIAGIVHEFGHILVGLIHGWRFCWLVIGPFGIKADQRGRIKFYLEKQMAMWGGVGATLPRHAGADNVHVWPKILLGGPIASIVVGMFFLPVGIVTENMVFLLLGAMALGMGIISILPLPLKTGILYTDGGRWSRLHSGGQKAEEEIALFKLAENEATGGDLSNLDVDHIEPLIQSEEAGIQYFGYYYLFRYSKAISNPEKMQFAFEKMKEIKSRVPAMIIKNCKTD